MSQKVIASPFIELVLLDVGLDGLLPLEEELRALQEGGSYHLVTSSVAWSHLVSPGHINCSVTWSHQLVTLGVTWKKEAETEGGGFRSSTSTGSARKTHMMLSEQDG